MILWFSRTRMWNRPIAKPWSRKLFSCFWQFQFLITNSNANIQAHALHNIFVSNDFPPMVTIGLEFWMSEPRFFFSMGNKWKAEFLWYNHQMAANVMLQLALQRCTLPINLSLLSSRIHGEIFRDSVWNDQWVPMLRSGLQDSTLPITSTTPY